MTRTMLSICFLTVSNASLMAANDVSASGTPEIIKVMDLDGLTVVGKPAVEKQYKYLREPNAAVTKDGTLIVVAGPHHVRGKNDRAHQDALCRTSKDGGRTWSDITMIADAGMDSVLPTVLVYDEQKDRTLFVYSVIFNDPDRDKSAANPSQQFVIHSDDAGSTWSAPQEILKDLSGICVFGGGNGFQLKQGKHKGRLVIPGGTHSGGFRPGFYYSDDHGETWSFQKVKSAGRLEATGCELDDGTIILARRQSGYGMAASFSRDGGATWSKQRPMLPDAWSSCNNSALAVHDAKGSQFVLVAAPLGPKNAEKYVVERDAGKLKRGVEDSKQAGRSNGGVFLSRDGGKTWPIGVCVAPGWTFGYNALVALPDGDIGLLFEGSPSGVEWSKLKRDHNTGARLGIYMVKFSLDWLLTQRKKQQADEKTAPPTGSRTGKSSGNRSATANESVRRVATSATGRGEERPNVLFISLDDMNDWIGCYGGHPDANTPNIDMLAKRGVLFTNAHCVSPICGPSRASVLTGMRPETTGVYHNRGKYIDYVPDAVTFPEMYDREKVRLPKTIRDDLADVSPPGKYLATKPWTSGTHETVTKHDAWRDAVHAYLATVSFVDALVGEVVAGLDSGPHADNTWIVLWSDHGWSLGEKQHWGKHVPWTECVRVPLIVIPPRGKQPSGFKAGSRCEARVSLLDLYPTLTDICGLPARKELEGRSLLPLIANPNSEWREAVVSTIGRGTHSVATDRWRYIRYFDGSEELYDLRKDTEEWTNIASRPEHKGVKRRLAAHIPQDTRLKQFVRWGSWKCVFPVKGKPMLFDYEGDFGISEQNDVAENHPDVVRAIQSYVEQAGADDRRVTMPKPDNKKE